MKTRLAEVWRDYPGAVVAAAVAAALLIALAVIWPVTDLIAAHDVGGLVGPLRMLRLQAAREAVRTELIAAGAGLAVAAALVYAAQTIARRAWAARAAGDGQVADRYAKAVEQLGSGKLDVRIGGIYALERVARDSARDHPAVMEVLAAFIREHSGEQGPAPGGDTDLPRRAIPPDVRAAITVVGRRNATFDAEPLSLGGADLRGTDLSGANLSRVAFPGANLAGAVLVSADLRGADLARVPLGGVEAAGADFTGACLDGAQLANADLSRAAMSGASLDGADLRGTSLVDTRLNGAVLTDAKLTGANLSGADLSGADLRDANLRGTDRDGAGFAGANLGGAAFSSDAAIPDGWVRDADSGRLRPATGALAAARTEPGQDAGPAS